MDKPKMVLLIEKGIVIPEDIKIYLDEYLMNEYSAVETNSIRVLSYMESLGHTVKVRLIDDFDTAMCHYFGLEEGCDLFVVSKGPMFYPQIDKYPYAKPMTRFSARDTQAIVLKSYIVDAHENPHLHYFK